MAAKDILFSQSARQKLLSGSEKLANAVKVTMGPRGRNAVIDRDFGAPRLTKDGVTVAKAVELEDKFENMGAILMKEAASKTADHAGDGTTTATVLAHAMFRKGNEGVVAGMNPMSVRRGIHDAVDVVSSFLKKIAKPIDGDTNQIHQVATISANGDAEIGKIIAEAMRRVGREGVITVEEAKSLDTELDVVEGMQFDRGHISPYFATNTEKMICELDNPYILLHDKKISSMTPLVPILEFIAKKGASCLIVAEDIEGEALSALLLNKLRGGLKVAAVKAPAFGDRREAILEDIAILTGGQVISEKIGMNLEKADVNLLGRAKKVIVTKDSTTVVEGNGDKGAIQGRCQSLRDQIAESTSDYDKEKLQERLAKLGSGVAVVRVGGASEIDLKERKDLVDDATQATRAAAQGGIVAGGGAATLSALAELSNVIAQKEKSASTSCEETRYHIFGMRTVLHALEEPARQIADNAGKEGAVIVNAIKEGQAKNGSTYGYDARNDQYGDMIAMGIIDPVIVLTTALNNAAAVAGAVLSTEVAITDIPKESAAPAGMGGGMGGGMGF